MRQQQYFREPLIVDEDEGIPTHLVDDYNSKIAGGPSPSSASPRTLLLSSMSSFDKTKDYEVYDYSQTSRPETHDYGHFTTTHPHYAQAFVGTQSEAASSLALSYLAPGQLPHDQAQYFLGAADTQHYTSTTPTTGNLIDPVPRQLPEVVSYSPVSGIAGIRVSVYFHTQIDLPTLPQDSITIMFGHKRCDSVVSRSSHSTSPYQYVVTASVPAQIATGSQSPQVPLAIELGGPVAWQTQSVEVGTFTYANAYPTTSPGSSRKRKLSVDAPARQSPTKKPSQQQLTRSTSHNFYAEASSSQPRQYAQPRRISQPGYQFDMSIPRAQPQQFYTAQPATARYQTEPISTVFDFQTVTPASRSALLPSPAPGNPPLIRTSTLHQSPTLPGLSIPTPQGFNPYAMYPANTKAILKLEGDLTSMVDGWTDVEVAAKRRLVQFQRSQSGSVISTTFEPVTLEERAPNSICVSCIYWQEKGECYVTSVDTIQLLESLVAVRFTVEEKNRIRRNLEGFRPATVSKTKQDSEEFFKLIMGFPNPKPRNIEKDVKVFPWRILSTALKKIIGKYSASYSSTAGVLHTPTASSYAMDQRTMASPQSTSSSATSHAQSYATAAMTTQTYMPPQQHTTTSLDLSAGPPGLRLSVPQATGQTWQSPSSAHYASAQHDISAASARTPAWDYASGLTGYSLTSMPGATPQYHYGNAHPATPMIDATGHQQQQLSGARFIPLHGYEQAQGHPTTSSA